MADIEVEVAVVVEVGPCGGSGPITIAPQSGGGGGVFKAALAGVVIEGVGPPARDKKVGSAVVIVVTDGDPVAVPAGQLGESGRHGRIVKAAVAAVAKEPVPEDGRSRRRRKLSSLDGIDI